MNNNVSFNHVQPAFGLNHSQFRKFQANLKAANSDIRVMVYELKDGRVAAGLVKGKNEIALNQGGKYLTDSVDIGKEAKNFKEARKKALRLLSIKIQQYLPINYGDSVVLMPGQIK